jgi:copper resistance protein B
MLRLRYEVSYKFARYIGYAYSGKYGNTARYSRQAGNHKRLPLRIRARLWF